MNPMNVLGWLLCWFLAVICVGGSWGLIYTMLLNAGVLQ